MKVAWDGHSCFGVEIDKEAAVAHWKEHGKELVLPAIGETVEF